MVNIELVYSPPGKGVVQVHLSLASGARVSDALNESGIYETYPETKNCPVGIFAKIASLDTLLREGDRVELYRPLIVDPKEKRRQLAKVRTLRSR